MSCLCQEGFWGPAKVDRWTGKSASGEDRIHARRLGVSVHGDAAGVGRSLPSIASQRNWCLFVMWTG